MAIDFKALANKAASIKDMTKATTGGGGDYTPPAAGPTRLRFISYIEIGKHMERGFNGGPPKAKDKVLLTFELSGKNHPPIVSESGEKIPVRITVEETLSLNEKAWFYKLFTRMNWQGKATHIAQLLGEAYRGEVIHRKYAKNGEPKAEPAKWTGVSVELFKKGEGYTIMPPTTVNEDDQTVLLTVAPAISNERCFIWDLADMEQWGSLFIDGEYPEKKNEKGEVVAKAKSKNVFQNDIKRALNFVGSPIHALLLAGGVALDIPDAESGRDAPQADEEESAVGQPAPAAATPSGAAATDVLNGIA